MKMAVEAVQSEGMSARKAAEKFGIHKSNQHYSVEYPVKLKWMPNQGGNLCTPKKWKTALWKILPTVLNKGMVYQGTAASSHSHSVQEKNNISGFKNFTPTKHLMGKLKNRPHELALRKPEKMGTVRSRMLNGVVVGRYFEDLQKLVNSFREFPWTNLQLRRNWKTARTHPSQCYSTTR